MVRRGRPSRRAFVLIVVMSILTALSVLSILFAGLSSAEVNISRNYVDSIRAKMLAMSGMEAALARLKGTLEDKPWTDPRIPSDGGDVWVFHNNYNDSKKDVGAGIELEDAWNPSFKDGLYDTAAPSTPSRSGSVAGTYSDSDAFGGDSFLVKVIDCASKINLNLYPATNALAFDTGPAFARLKTLLKNLGKAINAVNGSSPNPLTDSEVDEIIEKRDDLPFKIFVSDVQVQEAVGLEIYEQIRDYVTIFPIPKESAYPPFRAPVEVEPDMQPFSMCRPVNVSKFPTTYQVTQNTFPGYGDMHIGAHVVELRFPVNINAAPKPVLVALFRGVKGRAIVPVPPDPLDDLYGQTDFDRVEMKKVESGAISADDAKEIAEKIIERRMDSDPNKGPFTTFMEFEKFMRDEVESGLSGDIPPPPVGSPFGAGSAEAKRVQMSAVLANCNPNVRLNKMNPNYPLFQEVDKLDMTSYTTEICFGPTGHYDIESLGRVYGPNGTTPVAEAKLRAVEHVFTMRRHTTQKDFWVNKVGFSGDTLVPPWTDIELLPENLRDLADVDNIAQISQSTGDGLVQGERVLSGFDGQILLTTEWPAVTASNDTEFAQSYRKDFSYQWQNLDSVLDAKDVAADTNTNKVEDKTTTAYGCLEPFPDDPLLSGSSLNSATADSRGSNLATDGALFWRDAEEHLKHKNFSETESGTTGNFSSGSDTTSQTDGDSSVKHVLHAQKGGLGFWLKLANIKEGADEVIFYGICQTGHVRGISATPLYPDGSYTMKVGTLWKLEKFGQYLLSTRMFYGWPEPGGMSMESDESLSGKFYDQIPWKPPVAGESDKNWVEYKFDMSAAGWNPHEWHYIQVHWGPNDKGLEHRFYVDGVKVTDETFEWRQRVRATGVPDYGNYEGLAIANPLLVGPIEFTRVRLTSNVWRMFFYVGGYKWTQNLPQVGPIGGGVKLRANWGTRTWPKSPAAGSTLNRYANCTIDDLKILKDHEKNPVNPDNSESATWNAASYPLSSYKRFNYSNGPYFQGKFPASDIPANSKIALISYTAYHPLWWGGNDLNDATTKTREQFRVKLHYGFQSDDSVPSGGTYWDPTTDKLLEGAKQSVGLTAGQAAPPNASQSNLPFHYRFEFLNDPDPGNPPGPYTPEMVTPIIDDVTLYILLPSVKTSQWVWVPVRKAIP